MNSSQTFGATRSTVSSPGQVSRALGILGLLLGIVTVGLALAMLVWPKATLLVVAVLFGVQLVLGGIRRVALAVMDDDVDGWLRGVFVVGGVLMVIAGIICLRNPFTSLLAIALIVSVGWFVDGIVDIVGGATSAQPGRWLLVVGGAISVIGAGALLFWPGLVLVTLVKVGGWLLLVVGVTRIVLGVGLLGRRTPA